MNEHISREATYEYWPLDKDGNRILKEGSATIKELRFGAVFISGLKELEDHLRQEMLQALMPQVESCKTPEIAAMIVRSAIELGDKRRIGTKEFDLAVKSLAGIAYLTYLSLRVNHPEMTPSLALKIVSDSNTSKRFALLQTQLFTATGFKSDEGNLGN